MLADGSEGADNFGAVYVRLGLIEVFDTEQSDKLLLLVRDGPVGNVVRLGRIASLRRTQREGETERERERESSSVGALRQRRDERRETERGGDGYRGGERRGERATWTQRDGRQTGDKRHGAAIRQLRETRDNRRHDRDKTQRTTPGQYRTDIYVDMAHSVEDHAGRITGKESWV